MRRLLQFATWLLLMVSLAAPISEFFDRWDAPGLSNDAEFAVFTLILTLCLVLLVSRLIARSALTIDFTSMRRPAMRSGRRVPGSQCVVDIVAPPPKATQLRI